KKTNPQHLNSLHIEVHKEESELMGAIHHAQVTVTFLGIKRTQAKLVLSCPIYALTALMSNGNCETYAFVGLNQVFVGSGEFIQGELWPAHCSTPRYALHGPTVSLY